AATPRCSAKARTLRRSASLRARASKPVQWTTVLIVQLILPTSIQAGQAGAGQQRCNIRSTRAHWRRAVTGQRSTVRHPAPGDSSRSEALFTIDLRSADSSDVAVQPLPVPGATQRIQKQQRWSRTMHDKPPVSSETLAIGLLACLTDRRIQQI